MEHSCWLRFRTCSALSQAEQFLRRLGCLNSFVLMCHMSQPTTPYYNFVELTVKWEINRGIKVKCVTLETWSIQVFKHIANVMILQITKLQSCWTRHYFKVLCTARQWRHWVNVGFGWTGVLFCFCLFICLFFGGDFVIWLERCCICASGIDYLDCLHAPF